MWDCSSCFAGQETAAEIAPIIAFIVFAGCSVVSDLLFTPVDIGKVEVSCYDYIWWGFLCSV